MPMYKALLDKVSRGRNLPPKWAAFFIAGEKPGEMEAICSSFLPLLILCRPLLWLWALAWACGALSICWRATARTILVPKGYGSDNPGSKSQGMKQLMAGGGIILLGTTLIPLLSGLF